VSLPEAPVEVATTPRVGITRAGDLHWRYVLEGSSFLSRPLRRAAPSGPA
jgi:DNA-3-methyladenine glycosylase